MAILSGTPDKLYFIEPHTPTPSSNELQEPPKKPGKEEPKPKKEYDTTNNTISQHQHSLGLVPLQSLIATGRHFRKGRNLGSRRTKTKYYDPESLRDNGTDWRSF